MTTAQGSTTATHGEDLHRYGHLRFSIGLECADDLIADVARALDKAVGPR